MLPSLPASGEAKKHRRFAYFAYYRGLPHARARQIGGMEERHRDEVRHNLSESLPAAPAIREGERISPFLWMLQLPNQSRTVVTSGLAMIGDAALASDPAWGVGYGWALQSAEWLVDCAAEALRHGRDLEASLAAYRRRHRRQLAGHNFLIAEFASGWGFNPIEKLMLDGTAPPSGR